MKIGSNAAAGALAFLAALVLSPSSAMAQTVIEGRCQLHQCGGANAIFRRARGSELEHPIGFTKQVAVLTNTGVGTAGSEVRFTNPFGDTRFRSLLVYFRDAGPTSDVVKAHICFNKVSLDLVLNGQDFEISAAEDGWLVARLSAASKKLRSEKKDLQLAKATFSLSESGNITFGAVEMHHDREEVAQVEELFTPAGDCSELNNCD